MGKRYRDIVRSSSKAKRSARAVMMLLSDYADDDGLAFPGHARIADECGLSERTVTRCIAELVSLGEIEIVKANRQHHNPRYRILLGVGEIPQSRQSDYPESNQDASQSRQSDPRVDKLSPRVDNLSEPTYTRELEPTEPKDNRGESAPARLPIPAYLGGNGRQPHNEQRRPLALQESAKAAGLDPPQLTELTNLLLDLTGKRSYADTVSGGGVLREAQESVIALAEMGMGSPERLKAIGDSFWRAHPTFKNPPTFEQFLTHASQVKGGTVRNGTTTDAHAERYHAGKTKLTPAEWEAAKRLPNGGPY